MPKHIPGNPAEITFNTLQHDRQQHDGSAAFGIAQQYSSATFVSLHFHSSKKNWGAFKKHNFSFFTF
jgi:hypothetical protein